MNTNAIIKNYLSDNVKSTVSLVLISLLTIILKITNPIIIKAIIDLAIDDFDVNSPSIIILTTIMGIVTVATFFVDGLRQVKTVKYGSNVTSELRNKAYQTVIKSELHELTKIESDKITSTIVNAAHKIGDSYISNRVVKLSYMASLTVALLIVLLVFNPLYGFITALTIPMFFVISKYLTKMEKKNENNYLKNVEEHKSLINDNYNKLKVIKLRNGINKASKSYENVLQKNNNSYTKNVFLKGINSALIGEFLVAAIWFFMFLSVCIGLYNNNFNVANNLGSLFASLVVSTRIYTVFKSILNIYLLDFSIEEEEKSLNQIFALKAESRSETMPSLDEIHSLKFDNVGFDYNNYGIEGKVVLNKVDFEIRKGEHLGILGLPNSGKTTIADLVVKIIRPKQGSVLINNCDINKLNTYYLRDIVTYVPQNFKLLEGSIEENIVYPLTLDEYKYNDSLNKCRLKDLIFSLPNRDETTAADANLSPLDVQKIALANAFYKDSPIIILDDATSKLDSTSEAEIMNEFYKLKNKISIIITNRIYNLSKCDKIMVINNGHVIEYGKTEELLADKKSTFARMLNDYQAGKKAV